MSFKMSFSIFFWWIVKTLVKFIGLAFTAWIYKELTMGMCHCAVTPSEKRLKNRIVVITGATSGIGRQTAIELAKHGAKIIFGCRNLQKGKGVIEEIKGRSDSSSNEVLAFQLDLASKKSIEGFVNNVKEITDHVDILINNAGIAGKLGERFQGKVAKREVLESGLECTMGTNYFGHVYLTHLLLGHLKKGGMKTEDSDSERLLEPSMILNLSSFGHILGSLDKKNMDLNMEKRPFSPEIQYYNSKLAMNHFTKILAKKFEKENWNTVAVAINPGFVRTNIFGNSSPIVEQMTLALGLILGKNSLQGAQTTIHLALMRSDLSAKSLNGKYFSDCREEKWIVSRQIGDTEVEDKLWEETQRLLKIKFDI